MTTPSSPADLTIVPIETPTLGDRSYLISAEGAAVVVDPQRDIDRVLDLARDRGVRISHVLETHIHNDYVTGGLELSRVTGAQYVVPAGDDLGYERRAVRDGDVVDAGLEHLHAMPALARVNLQLCYGISAAGQAALDDALRGCAVEV